MSNRKVSELNEANSLGLNDLIMIVQNGTNKKIKSSNFLNVLLNNKGTLIGTNLTANDSADNKIDKFDIKGNSIQNGTPSPNTPVEIKSVGDNNSINIEIGNKNLLNIPDGTYRRSGITVVAEKGELTVNGTAIENSFVYIPFSFNFKPQKYSLSANNPVANGNVTIRFDGDKMSTQLSTTNKTTTTTFTEETTVSDLVIRTASGATLNNFKIKPQLEVGEPTSYKSYEGQSFLVTTQQPFRAIENYKDQFIRQNGKWYEKHYITEKILNGTENWLHAATRFHIELQGTPDGTYDLNNMCTHFTSTTDWNVHTSTYNTIAVHNGGWGADKCRLSINEQRFSEINDFKNWLASNNVIVDYVLPTPTLIECTQEQTIQLNEIASLARTYSPTTHIFSQDEVSPNMEVTYFKDASSLLA